jgi:DNA (cytosine-5)-methyltransferase 1
VADATGERCEETRQLRCNEPEERTSGSVETVADPVREGLAYGRSDRKPPGAHAFEWGVALAESKRRGRAWWAFEPGMDRVADGIPNRVDRIAAIGNAVVPQIPELIGRAILAAQQEAA